MLADVSSCEEMVEMVKQAPIGCVVELGVYQGGSAKYLHDVCKETGRQLYLYDTFEGIPFKTHLDEHEVGDFKDTSVDFVRALCPEAIVVQGVFPFSVQHMPPIAFAHIDADQYDSIRMALFVLGPMMVQGGVMWFDDVGCLDGADKALEEWVRATGNIPERGKSGKYFVRF